MAWESPGSGDPFVAASAIAQFVPVRFVGDAAVDAGSQLDHTLIRAGSWNEDVLGVTIATVASPGDPVSVVSKGFAKGIAGASLGAGARVGVGSTNGILIPLAATGGAASANLVTLRYAVGKAVDGAAAGDVFTVRIDPTQIV